MAIKASEISELIRQRIQNFESKAEARDVGTVIALTDGICRIHGLNDVQYGEMIEFPGNTYGLALNLEQGSVGAVVLGDYKHISEGDKVKTTGRILEVPVGPEMLGRVVNSLGADREGRARRHRTAVGQPARADGVEIHRLDGADRPRPARAHHRRPPDG